MKTSFKEKPSVLSFERGLDYCNIEWIHCNVFSALESTKTMGPSLHRLDGTKVYIGKSVPREDSLNEFDRIELIGSVSKNSATNQWQLTVTYATFAIVIPSNFLVLSIADSNSYEWKETSQGHIPEFALRGAVDAINGGFLFIGKTIANDTINSGMYFGNGNPRLVKTPEESLIGRVFAPHRCIYVALERDKEVAFQDYEVLCMKPSPASLTSLCKLVIRQQLGCSDSRIEKLRNYIPNKLLIFLKNPKQLRCYDCLMKQEKLISCCGKFEMFITDSRSVVCRDIASREMILYDYNVDAILLLPSHILLYHGDDETFTIFEEIDAKRLRGISNYRWSIMVKDFNCTKPVDTMIEAFDSSARLVSTFTSDFGPFHYSLGIKRRR